MFVRQLDEESIESMLHQDHVFVEPYFGMAVRNGWGMWDNTSKLFKDFCERFDLFGHGDDIYAVVMAGVFASLRKQDVQTAITEAVNNIREHWKLHNIDPKTGNQIGPYPTFLTILVKDGKLVAQSRGKWESARSSGYDGFRCSKCATWVYSNQVLKCDCDKDLYVQAPHP